MEGMQGSPAGKRNSWGMINVAQWEKQNDIVGRNKMEELP
jgi:hypothetical protein